MHADVIARDRAAFAARTEGQGGHQAGGQAYGAQRAHGVDQDAEDGLLQAESHDDMLIGGVDDLGMAAPAEHDQVDGAFAAGFPAVLFIPAQHGGQLFARERFALAGGGQARDDHARGLGDAEPGHTGQGLGGFAHGFGVDGAVGVEEQFAQPPGLFFIGEISALGLHELGQLVGDGLVGHHGLFGGADGGAVESLAGHDIAGRLFQVGAAVDVCGHIAGADAVGGFADRMGGLDHGAAAGGQDEAHVLVLEQFLGAGQGDILHAVDQVVGRARFLRGGLHDGAGFEGAARGRGVRGDDDGVARLDGRDGLVHGGRGGVGAGGQRGHHAHGPGDLIDAALGIVSDDAHGGHVLDAVPDALGGQLVLELLVGGDAEAGLVMRHLTQAGGGLEGCARPLPRRRGPPLPGWRGPRSAGPCMRPQPGHGLPAWIADRDPEPSNDPFG